METDDSGERRQRVTLLRVTWDDHGHDPEPDWPYHLRMGEVDAAEAEVVALEQVGHAREYTEPGVGGIAQIFDVDDVPLLEWGTSDHTVPVYRVVPSGGDARPSDPVGPVPHQRPARS